jgi:hypothetical protein
MPTVRATTKYINAGSRIQTQAKVKAKLYFYGGYGTREFTFPYAPVEVSYTGLARQYTELSRPNDFALLDSVAPQLMKVAIQFRVADPETHGQASIEAQLDNLRLISLLPGPILISGMDGYLSRPIYPAADLGSGGRVTFYRMTEFSVTVKRRNKNNQATQADCQMTLTEDRNPYVPVVSLAPIDYADQPSRAVGSVGTSGGGGGTAKPRITWTQESERDGDYP